MKMKNTKPVPYEDRTKWQGPPDADTAQAMANDKAWADFITRRDAGKKKLRETIAGRPSKNGGEYGAKMRQFDKNVAQKEAEDETSANDSVGAWEKNKPSPALRKTLNELSGSYQKSLKKTKPIKKKETLSYKSGGAVKGYGKARGGKTCKVC